MSNARIRFCRPPRPLHLLAGSVLAVAAATGVGVLLPSVVAFFLILVAVVVGSGLTGVHAPTRRDGFAGGLMLSWGGFFLGFAISVPISAAVQSRSDALTVAFAVLIGFVFGLLYGLVFALVGGSVGYIAARLANKPKWSAANMKLLPKLP